MKMLFWVSLFFLFYAYAGYPVVIWLVSKAASSRRHQRDESFAPAVSLLISAYNEESLIGKKIENALSLTYPKELLEIIVISDGSSDRTNDIVRAYASRGIALHYYEGRIGKTACLNRSVPAARGEIIVFSDANSMYDRDAVRNLVANFADNRIGFATGYTRYFADAAGGIVTSIGMYAMIEKFTKKAESVVNSCVGADGAIFAIRRNLYTPLRATDINDFVIPLSIIRQGYRGVLDERAFCIEKSVEDQRGEVKRQVRITNRTLRAIFSNSDLFNPVSFGLYPFELFSHKVAKFLSPFFATALVLSTVALANRGTVYLLFLLAQILLVLLAWIGYKAGSTSIISKIGSVCRTFVTMNLAIAAGWVQFLKGETYTVWSPVKR
jgi:cellulose synthase/poly-beta-1,6-N-acetylglucosamine synthase-like glycosyltransferase